MLAKGCNPEMILEQSKKVDKLVIALMKKGGYINDFRLQSMFK